MPSILALLAPAGIAAVLAGALFVWSLRRYRRASRARAVERFARRHGLAHARSDPGFPTHGFDPFAGPRNTFENVVSGRWDGVQVTVADHRGSGSARRLTVATAELAPSEGPRPVPVLPDEWDAETAGDRILVYGPLARAEDLALVFDMAAAIAGGPTSQVADAP